MKKNIVIADLDGTIADCEHRRHFVTGKNKDWQKFYAACIDDEPNVPVINTLRALKAQGYQIIIFSGRSDEVVDSTIEWLTAFDVPYDEIRMREAGDFTADEVLKKSWLNLINKDEILAVFDDRQKVVDMWREEGLVCFQVAPGNF